MGPRPTWSGRLSAGLRRGTRRVTALPRGGRLLLIGGALVAGFAAVVLPLFSSGGQPVAEVAGQLPARVAVGHRVRADLAIDNTGSASIHPVCIVVSGRGAHLVSANFQGLDEVAGSANRACGGQLTAQQTISVTIVFTVDEVGSSTVRVTPSQGDVVLGPPLMQTVVAS